MSDSLIRIGPKFSFVSGVTLPQGYPIFGLYEIIHVLPVVISTYHAVHNVSTSQPAGFEHFVKWRFYIDLLQQVIPEEEDEGP